VQVVDQREKGIFLVLELVATGEDLAFLLLGQAELLVEFTEPSEIKRL
jgi:hypothetical protein